MTSPDYRELVKDARDMKADVVKEGMFQGEETYDPLIQRLADAIEQQASLLSARDQQIRVQAEKIAFMRELTEAHVRRIQEVEKAFSEVFILRAQVHSLEKHKDELKHDLAATRREKEEMREALEPFAAFADPRNKLPGNMPITQGSEMARKQLTMGDCYRARTALSA